MESTALMQKLSQKRNLEAQWASEFIANGSVTLEMVNMNKKSLTRRDEDYSRWYQEEISAAELIAASNKF